MTSPDTYANGHLSQAQKDQYWRDGFLSPIDALSKEEAAQFRAELEQIETDWPDARMPLPLNTYNGLMRILCCRWWTELLAIRLFLML